MEHIWVSFQSTGMTFPKPVERKVQDASGCSNVTCMALACMFDSKKYIYIRLTQHENHTQQDLPRREDG